MEPPQFDALLGEPDQNHLRERMRSILAEIKFTVPDLANWMNDHRDYRENNIRSIQRMISGETNVSGEIMVILNVLLRQHRRLKLKYGNVIWQTEGNTHWAQIEEWYVFINPKTKGRWLLYCRRGKNSEDYSPPFGRWLDSLDEAKHKALAVVEEGMNNWAEIKLDKNNS